MNISTEKENSDLSEIQKATKVSLSSKKRTPLAEITTKKPVQPSVVKSKTKRPTKSIGGNSTTGNTTTDDDGIFTFTRSPSDPLALITEKSKLSGSKKRKKDEKRKSAGSHQSRSDTGRVKPVVKTEKLDIKTEFKIPKEPVSLPAKRKNNGIITGFASVKTETDLSNTTFPSLSTPCDESTPKRPKFNPRPRFCIDDSGDSD